MEKTTENQNNQAQSRAVAEKAAQLKVGSSGSLAFVDNRADSPVQRLIDANAVQCAEDGSGLLEFVDNRSEAAAQRKMIDMISNTPQAKQAAQMQAMMQNSPHHEATNRNIDMIRAAQRQKIGEEDTSTNSVQAVQLKENKTGMPDNLKSGLESLSGMSMDHVKVHYNSPEPVQLNAHAFTQGSDIHVASGQEKHLAHEGWHVAQQAQGRVQPTMQMAGTQINDDVGLEKEADVMGRKALSVGQRVVQRFEGGDGDKSASDEFVKCVDLTPISSQNNSSGQQAPIVSRPNTHTSTLENQQQIADIPRITQLKPNHNISLESANLSPAIMQLAAWKTEAEEVGATHYWDDLMDGVRWFSNGTTIWYKVVEEGSIDYSTLAGEKKTWSAWHDLRREAHPEEYPSIAPDELGLDLEDEADVETQEIQNFAGDLLAALDLRYVTTVKWEEGSGVGELLKKVVEIESYVKKDEGAPQSVYKNTYHILEDKFSADWNQRATDIEVGISATTAMYNSDLLTCHRHKAREFAVSKGIAVGNESEGFKIARHNINNEHWQVIYDQIPVLKRVYLMDNAVSATTPVPFGKTISHAGKSATNMWDVFRTMIPNTKAVFFMIQQNFLEYQVSQWRYDNGTATATVVRT